MAIELIDRLKAKPWHDRVIPILLLPLTMLFVLGLLLFFLPLGALSGIHNYYVERCHWRRLRYKGRTLMFREVRHRIAQDGGTLIIESPSLGWNFTHAWWTPEDVVGGAPVPAPTQEDYREALTKGNPKCLKWDHWCWDNYTCPESGRAFLLRVWNGKRMEWKLRRLFPELPVIHTWTAMIHDSGSAGGTSPHDLA